jgi:tetratricopeptide (TPR) repeat protein
MHKILVIFLLLSCFSAFADVDEGLSEALASFKQGEYESSRDQFKQMLASSPKNAIYWFNLGHVYLKLNKPKVALKCYRQVIKLKSPLAPVATYYEAKSLNEAGYIQKARVKLKEVLNNPTVPENVKDFADELLYELTDIDEISDAALAAYDNNNFLRAEALLTSVSRDQLNEEELLLLLMTYTKLNKLEEFQSIKRDFFRLPSVSTANRVLVQELEKRFSQPLITRKPFTLFLDMSVGHNSNVYVDGDSVDPLASREKKIFAGGSYQWAMSQKQFLRLLYTYNRNTYDEAPDLGLYGHSLRATYLKAETDGTLEFTPYYSTQNWSGTYVSNRYGINTLISSYFKSGERGLILDASRRVALVESYDYLNSFSGSARAYLNWWTSSLIFELSANAGYDGTKNIEYGDGSILPLTHLFFGPSTRLIYKFTPSLHFTALASYYFRNYTSASMPNDKQRNDREIYYSTRLAFYFIPSSSVYLQLEGFFNQSTLNENDVRDKNYHINISSVGITWDFL